LLRVHVIPKRLYLNKPPPLSLFSLETVYIEQFTSWSERSQAYVPVCGLDKDCTIAQASRDDQPVVVKTHYPFFGPELRRDECVSAVLTTVRHPLDNFVAWAR
jgi:hypothetical protein